MSNYTSSHIQYLVRRIKDKDRLYRGDTEEALYQADLEIQRLRDELEAMRDKTRLIDAHNRECIAACGNTQCLSDECTKLAARNKKCSACPRHWMITEPSGETP